MCLFEKKVTYSIYKNRNVYQTEKDLLKPRITPQTPEKTQRTNQQVLTNNHQQP